MDRVEMINTIGISYHTKNIEGGEYSYVKEAGSKDHLVKALGYDPSHYKLDIRFEDGDYVVLIETKQNFVETDIAQLKQYLDEENALHRNKKIICILANTNDNKLRVWKDIIDGKTAQY